MLLITYVTILGVLIKEKEMLTDTHLQAMYSEIREFKLNNACNDHAFWLHLDTDSVDKVTELLSDINLAISVEKSSA